MTPSSQHAHAALRAMPRTGRLGRNWFLSRRTTPTGRQLSERIKARLRRHVVERCIYGVDINPLAVELARVSLWIATLDPDLPFSFLDHKIKVGNSLVGCWLDRVEDYPLKAWEREGGDGKNGDRTGRIETFLKGEKVGNRRRGDGSIKMEMRNVIDTGFPTYRSFPEMMIIAAQWSIGFVANSRSCTTLPTTTPMCGKGTTGTIILANPARRAQAAMDEWCAVWFWPTDEESLHHVPTPVRFHSSIRRRLSSSASFRRLQVPPLGTGVSRRLHSRSERFRRPDR